jgi:hypothetical protein
MRIKQRHSGIEWRHALWTKDHSSNNFEKAATLEANDRYSPSIGQVDSRKPIGAGGMSRFTQ